VSDNPQAYELDRPLSRYDSAAIGRRRRAKNLAMLAVLVGLVGLFYAISMTKILRG
jgi:uncharacterized protein involved in exopolysaccharide biosynthesis